MIATAKTWFRPLLRNERGVGAIEFALVLPLLALLVVGIAQTGAYVMMHQNLNATTARMGDLITQKEKLSAADLAGMMNAVEHLVDVANFKTQGVVIVSAVKNEGGAKKVKWQQRGAGESDARSEIGVAGGAAKMPDDFVMAPDETVIVVELFYAHGSYLQGIIDGALVHKVAFNRGRIEDLATLEQGGA